MRIFFDTSAFAKRYVHESNTAAVLRLCEQATEIALSTILVPELISAFCRLRREQRIDAKQYRQIKADMLADIADAILCDTTPQVLQLAVRALEHRPLRGMDAIHIGCALACTAQLFVSADERQCAAAASLGLRVRKV